MEDGGGQSVERHEWVPHGLHCRDPEEFRQDVAEGRGAFLLVYTVGVCDHASVDQLIDMVHRVIASETHYAGSSGTRPLLSHTAWKATRKMGPECPLTVSVVFYTPGHWRPHIRREDEDHIQLDYKMAEQHLGRVCGRPECRDHPLLRRPRYSLIVLDWPGSSELVEEFAAVESSGDGFSLTEVGQELAERLGEMDDVSTSQYQTEQP